MLDWSAALDSDGNIDLKSSINATLVNIDTIIGADLVSFSRPPVKSTSIYLNVRYTMHQLSPLLSRYWHSFSA